ncbi:purine-cytosine permease family protein [Endozoicomonas sp.]|uniref:purine-cytosine permease family protein n=1 Tax=Endozoicomonas sp. TaxID=1892382 RepID=UPI0028854215|nr:cytosine permease [Endozoicomonas sp.]
MPTLPAAGAVVKSGVCEQYGLQPVPKSQQVGGGWPLFNIYSNLFINPGTLITSGMMVLSGLSFQATVSIQVVSVLVGMIPFLLLSRAGVRYGIPGQVLCRAVFGIRGARWITSILRLLCSIYWFAFQTAAGALAIETILRNCFQWHFPLWGISLVFAVFQGAVAIAGYVHLKWLSVFSFPVKLAIFILLALFLFHAGGEGATPSAILYVEELHWSWALAALWFNTIVSTCFTCVTDASDFTRYTRSQRSLLIGTLSGSFAGTLIAASFGAYAVIAGGAEVINPFETITRLQPNSLVIALMVLVIFLDNWTINVINLYTGGLSLCNAFDKLGRFRATVIVTVIAALLSCFPEIISDYVRHMGTIGTLFAPVTGILLVWYFYDFKMVDLPSLYTDEGKYWYVRGFNLFACLLIPLMFFIGQYLPDSVMPTVILMIITSFTYYLMMLLRSRLASFDVIRISQR